MSIVYVNLTTSTSGVNPQNFVISRTAGNLLVLCIQAQSGGDIPTVVGADTWLKSTNSPKNNNGGSNWEYIFYAIASGSGADTLVITWSSNYSYRYSSMYEFSGIDTSTPYIMDAGDAGTSNTLSSGTLTLTGNSVIVAQFEQDNDGGLGGFTPNSGYTAYSPDGGYIYSMYHIVATSEVAGGTIGASQRWGIIAAAFRESGGGPPPSRLSRLPLLGGG